MDKTREHVALLKAALNKLSDSTGGMRSPDADAALSDAWVAAFLLERDAGASPAIKGEAAA